MSKNYLYSKSHEWASFEKDADGALIATIGLSKFALDSLTDLVYMDLPEVGKTLEREQVFGEIESVKAVSEMYAPVAGEIIAVNHDVADQIESLASLSHDKAWLIKIKVTNDQDCDALLDEETYKKYCETGKH